MDLPELSPAEENELLSLDENKENKEGGQLNQFLRILKCM